MKRKSTLLVVAVVLLALSTALLLYWRQTGIKKQDVYRVGIVTLTTHPSLDALQEGLKEKLAAEGFVAGRNVIFVERNANGQVQAAATIANDLATQDLDVVVPITTPIAQAVVKAAKAPVVFSAVTDPIGAGITASLEKPQPTITGASDAWPYHSQLKLIREILPTARRLGVLFNPGDAAAQYGIERIRRLAPKEGFELVEGSISATSEVFPVASNLAQRVDALFLSSDSLVIAGIAGAVRVAIDEKVPLFVGDSGTVAQGGIGAVSVGYRELGRTTGGLVARILRGERNIPIVVASGDEVYLNTEAAQLMGVSIPPKLLSRATRIYTSIE